MNIKKWFNNQKIGRKILLSNSILLLLIMIIEIQGILFTSKVDKGFTRIYNIAITPAVELNNMAKNMLLIHINMIKIRSDFKAGTSDDLTRAQSKIDQIVELRKKNEEIWNKFISGSITQDSLAEKDRRTASDFKSIYDSSWQLYDQYITAVINSEAQLSEDLNSRWEKSYDNSQLAMDQLINTFQETGNEIRREQESSSSSIFIISLVMLVIALTFGYIITIVLTKAVSVPVSKGLEFARKIAAGNLTERFELIQEDELGQLGSALNEATRNLENLVSNVISNSQSLAQAVVQISEGNQNLSQRTSEQSSSLEQIASTIEQTTVTITRNAENAAEANIKANNTSRLAEEGVLIVNDAVKSINEINISSKKIADIISMINEIAFQTNLLALNAAVEAARAGEQGRGFAVVAGEVRNLAQRAASAAKEIGSLIHDSVEKIEGGTELVYKSGDALKKITQAVNEMSGIISEIAAASQEQKQGIEQVNKAIVQMDSMTQQNAALVEETATAGQAMASQAQELLLKVDKFKVTGDAVKRINDNDYLLSDGNNRGKDMKDLKKIPQKITRDGFEAF